MSKLLSLFAAALAAGLVALPVGADDKAAPKLEGQYTMASSEEGGKPLPEDELTGKTVRITAEKITVTDKEGKEVWAATYTLDAAKKPCAITMKGTGSNDGKEFRGLVERTDNNQVRIVFNLDGGDVPTEFKTKEKQKLVVLKPTA